MSQPFAALDDIGDDDVITTRSFTGSVARGRINWRICHVGRRRTHKNPCFTDPNPNPNPDPNLSCM